MPTNRPFFANFLAAFRAHSSPAYKATLSSNSPSSLPPSTHVSTSSTNVTPASARSIASKAISSPTSQLSNNSQSTSSPPSHPTTALSTTAAAATLTAAASSSSHHHKHHPTPLSRSPGVTTTSTVPHNMSLSPPVGSGPSTPYSRGRQRRGSDSSNSSGGFIDALGPEKWYIGGRTSSGEEKFYRLALVTGAPGRRVRSLDRLSL